MSVVSEYNEKLNYVLIIVKENATIVDAENRMQEIAESDVIPSNVNALWDVRELLFDHIDIDFLKRFVAVRKKYNSVRGGAKIAVLSNSALSAPLIKLYTILSIDLQQKTKSFRMLEEAELWLCEDLLKGSNSI